MRFCSAIDSFGAKIRKSFWNALVKDLARRSEIIVNLSLMESKLAGVMNMLAAGLHGAKEIVKTTYAKVSMKEC